MTNSYKPGSLKLHRCIILWLYSSEVQNGSHWVQVQVPTGCIPFLEALEENVARDYIFLPLKSQCVAQCLHIVGVQ